MTIDFKDKKFDSIDKIKNHQESGKDYFSQKEKGYFFGITTLKGAQEVANLLTKIKETVGSKKKWTAEDLNKVIDEIELEKVQNTFAFRTLNADLFVSKSLTTLYLKHDLLKGEKLTEDQRKAKVTEIHANIGDSRKKIGIIETKSYTSQTTRDSLFAEKKRAELLNKRGENLILVLKKDGDLKLEDPAGGGEKKLNVLNLTLKDYVGSNLMIEDESATPTSTKTVDQWVDYANAFLNQIKSDRDLMTIPATSNTLNLGGIFNDIRFNSKNNLVEEIENIGHSYLLVLRDIGVDKLKACIDASTSSTIGNKSDTKKLVDKALKNIDRFEPFGYEYVKRSDKDLFMRKKIEFQREMLKKEKDDFPYVDVPNYKAIFELMKRLFPVNLDSNGKVKEIKSFPFLDNKNDTNFLKPSDSSKVGWDDVYISGYIEKLKNPAVSLATKTANQDVSHMQVIANKKWADGTSPNPILLTQDKALKVANNLNFKSLTLIWWKTFEDFMEDKEDVTKNGWSNNDVTYTDAITSNRRNQLRFCKTIRNLLKELKLIDDISEVDEILLEVAADYSAGKKYDSLEKILKNRVEKRDYEYLQLIKDKGGVPNYVNYIEKIVELFEVRKENISALESKIDSWDKMIRSLEGEKIEEQMKIDAWNAELSLLQQDEDFDKSDLAGKKKKFEDLYKKKDESDRNNKWFITELSMMNTWLDKIKKEMKDDTAFDAEFKTKQDEVSDLLKNAASESANLVVWNSVKGSEGTLEKAIIKVKKDGESLGITLESIKVTFEKIMNYVKLDSDSQNQYDKIKDAIEHPEKYKDEPQEKEIDITGFKTIPVFANADDNLLKKWKELPDSNGKYKKKSEIETLINRVVGDTTKKGKFVEHIKDDPNIGTGSDDEKLGNFFTKTEPKKVIETILTHEKLDTDDKKNTEKGNMKKWSEGSGDSKKVLNMTEYGSDKEDGEPNDEGVLKFLYEAEIGAGHKTRNASESNEENDNGEKKTGVLNHLKNNWQWYALGMLGVLVLLAVIFWKNISEWWNGPAEEEGKGAEDNEKEEEENE